MGRGQGREASELLFGRPVRGRGPQDQDSYFTPKSWPERYDDIEDFAAGPDPYDWLDHGKLIYVPEPFATTNGTMVYDALYLSRDGFTISLGSDSATPGVVETYPSLVDACRIITDYRRGQPADEFSPPSEDKLDVNADEVLALMEKNVVWKS